MMRNEKRINELLQIQIGLRNENQRNTNRINSGDDRGGMADSAQPATRDESRHVGPLVIRGRCYRPSRSNFRRWK